jgi:transposase
LSIQRPVKRAHRQDAVYANYIKGYAGWKNACIELFYLSPYSPEYNPDEYLNRDLKL